MKIKDLKPDDYYYAEYNDPDGKVIVKGTIGDRPNLFTSKSGCDYWSKNQSRANINIRLATSEEIHWLDCCILKDQFVSFEKAMKSYNNYQNKKILKKDTDLDKILIKLLNL